MNIAQACPSPSDAPRPLLIWPPSNLPLFLVLICFGVAMYVFAWYHARQEQRLRFSLFYCLAFSMLLIGAYIEFGVASPWMTALNHWFASKIALYTRYKCALSDLVAYSAATNHNAVILSLIGLAMTAAGMIAMLLLSIRYGSTSSRIRDIDLRRSAVQSPNVQ